MCRHSLDPEEDHAGSNHDNKRSDDRRKHRDKAGSSFKQKVYYVGVCITTSTGREALMIGGMSGKGLIYSVVLGKG